MPKPLTAADRDQYYTRPSVAEACVERLLPLVEQGLGSLNDVWFVEPSAGGGVFVDALEQRGGAVWAGDIEPHHPRVATHNFLNDPLPRRPRDKTHTCVVGNPPFGRKSALAVAFLNRSLEAAPLVGFVVPIQFRKWSAQNLVIDRARLVWDETLPEDAFLFLGKPYRLRSCFQVWTTLPPPQLPGNLRLLEPLPNTHPDFTAWQFNCTPIALKYFGMDWDFAVLRQGFGDFNEHHLPEQRDQMDRRKQWVFLKAHTPEALAVLKALDFEALSKANTGTPGFGKADLVQAYLAATGRQ